MNPQQVCSLIQTAKVIPVIRAPSAALALRAVDALLQGGLTVFEIALTTPNAVSVIETLGKLFAAAPAAPLLVGAGSVLDNQQAQSCIDAGAQFIVSPAFDPKVVALARAQNVAVMPGALTPTEVLTASVAGASMVKIFPCSALGGPSYLKALKAPLPNIDMVATGGVTAKNARAYLDAGAAALGVGADLVDLAALETDGPGALIARAREYLAAVAD